MSHWCLTRGPGTLLGWGTGPRSSAWIEQRTSNPPVARSNRAGGAISSQRSRHIRAVVETRVESLPRICRERVMPMGTMRERSPGKWELVVSAGVNPATGRYHRVVRTVATTSKREAKAALATLEAAVAAGNVSFDDPTLSSLLERWMEHITSLGRADTTLYNYRQYIDREIVPVLGSIRLSRLKALDIDRLYGSLRKRGLAPATIRQVHAILRASLNQAERWGLVQRNVAKLASAPSQPQREQHPPTVAQVRTLIAAAEGVDPLFGLYVRVMVATGARRAELCGLRWSDVDFEAGTLSIARSYTVVPGVRGDRPTKTRSTRLVILDPVTLEGLRSAMVRLGCSRGGRRCRGRQEAGRLRVHRRSHRRDGVASRHSKRSMGQGEVGRRTHRRSTPRSAALSGHTATRRRGPRANGGGAVGARRRHHHDEDLRTPHPPSRSTSRRRRRTLARLTTRGRLLDSVPSHTGCAASGGRRLAEYDCRRCPERSCSRSKSPTPSNSCACPQALTSASRTCSTYRTRTER